ncbi:hypothetical protein [Streptomyces boncukensis]|uniref:Large membrane protein n=1 Tax=Streptomyces boncukensis TaxID=2711219 RepID=A0A6G4WXE8_9ACTN|nr:hypothetical protein [Streptomyces boncukensis]NGO69287.1 hypothetical protein [Streptomyces boncukensis]
MTDPTRLLCAAAYLRPNRAAEFADKLKAWRRKKAKELGDKFTPKSMRERRLERLTKREAAKEKSALERLEKLDEDEPTERKQPRVLVGHEYVRWVRRRVADQGRPVPSHGFDLETVLTTCAQAEQLLWLRRTLMVMACALSALLLLTPIAYLAPLAVVLGLCAAFFTDRLLAQRRLHALIRADKAKVWHAAVPRRFRDTVDRIRDAVHGEVVPYRNQVRSTGSKYHFVGAGKVWYETQIGFDVVAAKPSEGSDAGSEDGDGHSKVLPGAKELLTGAMPEGEVIQFTPDDLHAHVTQELQRAVDPRPDFHPESRQEVFGVAALAAERWDSLTPERWAGLVTLAREGALAAGAQHAPTVARRFLCARTTSWDDELIASVFVGFSYENHYLRVVVRPHVVNPLHPEIRAAERTAMSRGWKWRRRMAYLAVVDTAWFVARLFKRGKESERNPAGDPGKGPVSLREIYSTRYMDDMLQYDDARRYIEMMQGRVLSAVEGFLEEHNVDTGAYREQMTVVLNNGVINTGEMSNVQNQPGAVGSRQAAVGGT